MGFTPTRRIYTLDFADTDLDGLTVKVGAVDLETFLELAELQDQVAAGGGQGLAAFRVLTDQFCQVVRGWDLEDENGHPVPIEGAAFRRSMDMPDVLTVIRTWSTAVSDVPAPLDPSSSGGGPSVVELPPMAPLSENLAS